MFETIKKSAREARETVKEASKKACRIAKESKQLLSHMAEEASEQTEWLVERLKLEVLVDQTVLNAEKWAADLEPSLNLSREESHALEHAKFKELTEQFVTQAQQELGREARKRSSQECFG